jgi:PAS domain-containing protein
LAYLTARFDNIEAKLQDLPKDGVIEVPSCVRDSSLVLRAEDAGGLTQITLIEEQPDETSAPLGQLAHSAMLDELTQLRDMLAASPMLVWRENAAGDVIWANKPYLMLVWSSQDERGELGWPLPKLFNKVSTKAGSDHRQCLAVAGLPQKWFEIATRNEGESILVFATPADPVVQAETALRDFMQTLTKTFAQLPIGLAIFDHHRKLQLFNPALMDLTDLPPDFLTARPSMLAVLDAMRERKMLPEPKNYRDWRRQVVQMEKAAALGLYEETWSLPDGQTYKVVGRPHPNGALALLIEDISKETTRTRRYRADLELGQSVIDELAEAIAVFSQAGELVITNAAYAKLWQHDPAVTLAHNPVRSLAAHWQTMTAPTTIWTELDNYVATVGDRESWQAEVRLLDGRLLSCHFKPLAGGATMVRFKLIITGESVQPRLAENTELLSA